MGSAASASVADAANAAPAADLEAVVGGLNCESRSKLQAALVESSASSSMVHAKSEKVATSSASLEVQMGRSFTDSRCTANKLAIDAPRLERLTSRSGSKLARVPKVAKAGLYQTDSAARVAFDTIDCNQDGLIHPDEVIRYLVVEGHPEKEAQLFVKRSDFSKDGRINFEEFKRSWAFLCVSKISGHEQSKVLRRPGSLSGMHMVIEDCSDTTIVIADHTSQVVVDDLRNCRVLVGPCAGSVFIRKCSGCTFSIAAQQLRTRQVSDCTIYLYVATEPIIETSFGVRFATFNAAYPQAEAHFQRAHLNAEQNLWWAVYDFNADAADAADHWSELPSAEWTPWELELQGQGAPRADVGEPQNPVPRDARAPLPEDSMRGRPIRMEPKLVRTRSAEEKGRAVENIFERYRAENASTWDLPQYQRFQVDSGLEDLEILTLDDFEEMIELLSAKVTGFNAPALQRLLEMLELDAVGLHARLLTTESGGGATDEQN